ncbi:MAG: carotenoid biosynthesis protein [Caldilineaceae bacterium]
MDIIKRRPLALTIAQGFTLADRLAWLCFGAWLLTMIAIPIVRWRMGEGAVRWGVSLSVCLLALSVLITLFDTWGWRMMVRCFVIVASGGWAIEWVGSNTGIPFGVYHYTTALQPQLAGVPLLIPLAWLMMLPPAWAVGSCITLGQRDWRFVAISAAAFTAWDLFLDPQMVGWGYWVWSTPGQYFGIPLSNFGGWLLSAALLTILVRPAPLPKTRLITIYAVTWFLQSFGQLFFWQMAGPALAGCLGMGGFLYWAYRRNRQ